MARKSVVWKHFYISPGNENHAICKHCNAKCSRGGNTSKTYTTSGLLKHLTCKHGEQLKNTLFDDADDGIDENQGVTMPKTLTPTKQATLEGFMQSKKLYDINDKRALAISERIARMIALDLQPFSIVEDRGFKELVLYFDPRYTMPSRKYFSETVIPGMYDRCENTMNRRQVT